MPPVYGRDPKILMALEAFHPDEPELWHDQYLKSYRGRERSAPREGKRWDLSLASYWDLVLTAGGRCQITTQPFNRYIKGVTGKRPFLPSIDRINPLDGYHPGNVELLTVIANVSLSDYGREAFLSMVRNALASEALNQHIAEMQPQSGAGPLDNILPWIKNNATALYVLNLFNKASVDE